MSEKTVAVLSLIADGHPDITYVVIFAAAEEALALYESKSEYHARVARIKERYPMAYEKWSEGDDRDSIVLHRRGKSVEALSKRFKRQPSALRSRIDTLGIS